VNKYLHTVASVGFLFTLNYDARNHELKKNQLHVTCFIISLFNVQHVSDVNTSILRSLRLIC